MEFWEGLPGMPGNTWVSGGIGSRQNRRDSTFPLAAAGNALGSAGEKAGLVSVSVSDLLAFMVMVFLFQL